jgi:hypothetical protein
MKVRHAAALALVGWYLMVPPSMRETNWLCGASLTASVSHELFGTGDEKECAEWAKIANANAPLSEWHETSPFETLNACEEAREVDLRHYPPLYRSMRHGASLPTIHAWQGSGLAISPEMLVQPGRRDRIAFVASR